MAKYNRNNNIFEKIPLDIPLKSLYIKDLIDDRMGNLWISLLSGVCRYNISDKSIFYTELNAGEFARMNYVFSSTITKEDDLFLSGINGLTYIATRSLSPDTTALKVFISGIRVLNNDHNITDKLKLSHNDSHFTFEFAVPFYSTPNKIRYAYMLVGYDTQWQYTDATKPQASYSKLRSGHYTFLVKSTNTGGNWLNNTVATEVEILPPPWTTWWSYLTYFVLASIIIFLAVRTWLYWLKTRTRKKIYENFSKNLRTPLSLLIAPIQSLIDDIDRMSVSEARELLETMQRNCRRLSENVDRLTGYESDLQNTRTVKKNQNEHSLPVVEKHKGTSTIFIIDSDGEICNYLKLALQSKYRVKTFCDYEHASNQIYSSRPSMVILEIDSGQPIDGYTICSMIKSNPTTSDIPVLFLSTMPGQESRTKGYESGADGYIVKPFEISYLLLRINQLLSKREIMVKKIRKDIISSPKELKVESTDEKFLFKARGIVERYMSDENFSVEEFAAKMSMSTSTLYRHIERLTGQSPVEFIRSFKLKRADQLLREGSYRIAEVAVMVGMSNASYLSTCYKKEFGMSPSKTVREREHQPQE